MDFHIEDAYTDSKITQLAQRDWQELQTVTQDFWKR